MNMIHTLFPSYTLVHQPTKSPSKAPFIMPVVPLTPMLDLGLIGLDQGNARLHIVDQTKTHCPIKSNGRRSASCWETLTGVELKVFDQSDLPFIFRAKDADVFFNWKSPPAGSSPAWDPSVTNMMPVGSGEYIVVARYFDSAYSNKWIYSSKRFDQFTDSVDIKFMVHIKRDNRRRWFAGKRRRCRRRSRKLEVESDLDECTNLEIIHPQYTVWDNSTEIYPLNIFSNSTCEIDLCALTPPGFELVAVRDEEDVALPITGECEHSLTSGNNVILFFELRSIVDYYNPDVEFELEAHGTSNSTNSTQDRRILNTKETIEIGGYWGSTKEQEQAGLVKMLQLETDTGGAENLFG